MSSKLSAKQGLGFAVLVVVAGLGIWYWTIGQADAPADSASDNPPPVQAPPGRTPIGQQLPPGITVGPGAIPPTMTPEDSFSGTNRTPSEDVEIPPVRTSRFENTSQEARYVGSGSCIKCHQDEHESYLSTSHSRSLREADTAMEPPDGELEDPVSRRFYQIYREMDQLRHKETLRVAGEQIELADHAVRYVVGSGTHAHTYLVETPNGFLAESPVSWYASRQDWALSPGFEHNNSGFARPVYTDCLFCHVGRVEALGGNRSRAAVRATAIDCERCHGPGSLHVASQEAAETTSETDWTIVDPARLSREQNEAICAQCHLDSAADVDVRGRTIRDFRPGQWIEDFRVHYGLQTPNSEMTVVGHVEQLHLSNCYRGSETLTCTTCHESHHTIAEPDRLDFYRNKCLDCHLEQPCTLPKANRLEKSPDDNCMTCHMPSSATEVLHVAATHHRIGIHPDRPSAPENSSVVGELIPLGEIGHLPKIEQDRCLGLGYLEVSVNEANPQLSEAYRVRARDLLEDVKRRGLDDPVVDVALARMYQRENPPMSIQLAESALQSPAIDSDARTKALFALSNAYLGLKQTALAIDPLEQLVELRRQAGDWFYLGVCRLQAGDIEGALEAAHQAAEIRPDRSNFQALLAELYRQSGQSELAEKHAKLAEQLASP